MEKLREAAERIYEGRTKGLSDEVVILRLATDAAEIYQDGIDRNALPELEDAVSGMLQMTIDMFNEFNAIAAGNGDIQQPVPESLSHPQIAKLILLYNHVAVVTGRSIDNWYTDTYERILLYQEEGDKEGTYTEGFFGVAARFYPDATAGEVLSQMRDISNWVSNFANKRRLYKGRKLVPVNNGIFDLKAKKLLPFTPKHAFDFKWPVDYVTGPDGPVMRGLNGVEWDIDRFMDIFTYPVNDESEHMRCMPAVWFLDWMTN